MVEAPYICERCSVSLQIKCLWKLHILKHKLFTQQGCTMYHVFTPQTVPKNKTESEKVNRNANTGGKLEQIQVRVLQDAPRAGPSNPGHDRVMYPLHLLCHMHLLLSIRRFFLITGTKYKYKKRQKN